MLQVKSKTETNFDILSLGEVMLRLDPSAMRIRTARSFLAWEGGGEYNVARGLRKCFGMRAGIATAFADNEIGRLIEDLILQGGVDTRFIQWKPFDGLGRSTRNGLNFTERGFGIRGAVGVSDRGHTAASQLKRGDFDWDKIFSTGIRWFHTGGIFAGLSETTSDVIDDAMLAAKKHGTLISYDLNYRPSLWKNFGGQKKSQEVNRRLIRHVDVLLGNEEDFTACLGFHVPETKANLSSLDSSNFKKMLSAVSTEFSNLKVVATTLRTVKSANINDWGAVCWANGVFHESTLRENLEIWDRVGGGDSFASGLIYGLMEKGDAQLAVEYGAAHGALAMTTPGDTSMATLSEVEHLLNGGNARVAR